jgi:hypothetical protein
MIPDHSVDFIFSFDSLVHAEADVLDAYLSQFKRILRLDGAAFIHHSNYRSQTVHKAVMAMTRVRGLRRLVWRLRLGGIQPNDQWRAVTMSAARFSTFCTRYGLRCIQQELINWDASFLIDCFSTAVRDDSTKWPQEPLIINNPTFTEEVARIRAAATLAAG